MKRLVYGDPSLVTIEVAIEEPVDPDWWYGHFRIVTSGGALGNWQDVVTLRAVVNWWRSFVVEPIRRWDTCLAGLDAQTVFDIVYSSAFVDPWPGRLVDAFRRYSVSHLGMSALDAYDVLLCEPPGKGQWLLWRRGDDGPVRDVRLPAGTLEAVGAEFVEQMSSLRELGD